MSEFITVKLGDVIELKRGYDLPQQQRKTGQFPIVSSSGITDRHLEARVKSPGVVTGRYGTLGGVYYITEDFWPLNTTLYVRDFKGNHPRFISYFLKSLDFSAYSDKAAVPGLNRNHLHTAQVIFPSTIHEQKVIASILGSLDDKIELNRQMNETLEAMARAIFKDWFVDFGPTRAKMERRPPYLPGQVWSLFPDTIDEETGLPQGWEESKVSKIGQVICGKTPSTKVKEFYGVDVPFITIPDMRDKVFCLDTTKYLSQIGEKSQHKKTLPPGSLCVSCIATPGLVVITTLPSQTNQQINSVIPTNPQETYYWYWILRDLGEEIRQAGSGGSVLHNLSTERFKNLDVLKPSCMAIISYSDNVSSIFEKILENSKESRTLAELRDRLLPKLMSGEIRVKEAEKMIGDAV